MPSLANNLSREENEELLALLLEKERRFARKSLWAFCLYYDYAFFSKRPFLEKVAEAFQGVCERKIMSLSISMPPRAGKSYITSLGAAWYLGNNPEESIMRNTCTATLYRKFSYDTRAIVISEKFMEVFPDVKISDDRASVDGWNLKRSRQVGYFGGGVGGTIIGFGASGIAITDDLYKSLDDALSETTNEAVHRWKESAHDSRLERNCPIIDIGTRWTKRDVIGKGIEEGKYDVSIVISALTEDGKSFCEDVKTTEEYIKIKNSVAQEIWSGEYMQEPAEIEGLLFRASDLKTFKKEDIAGQKPESILGYADIADQGDDSLSVPFAKIFKGKIFIDEVLFTKQSTDVTVELLAEMIKRINPDYVRMEGNGMGNIFANSVRKLVESEKVLTIHNSTSKHSRILNMYGFILKYCHFLDKSEYVPGSDYDRFMRELTSYMRDGKSKHDDSPDSLSGLAYFIQSWLGSTLFE